MLTIRRCFLMALLCLHGMSAHAQATQLSRLSWTTDDKGCKHFNAAPKLEERVSWTGSCVDGLAAGDGVQQWSVAGSPTARYSGLMARGLYEGRGRHQSADGIVYEGDFVAGQRNGHGELAWGDGRFLEGEFLAGVAEGPGIFVSANGKRTEVRASKGFVSAVRRNIAGAADAIQGADAPYGAASGNAGVGTADWRLLCSEIPPPVLPPVSWSGEVELRAMASVIEGRVVSTWVGLARGSADRRTLRSLSGAVSKVMTDRYECRGDFVFEQDFAFRVSDPK